MNAPVRQPDFAVIGGGLCGRLVAWRLAGAGHEVALYERGDAAGTQSAAWVAAAMLAPLAEAASAELLITQLGVASLASWPRILADLLSPVFFQRNGTLVVWHHTDRSERRFSSAGCARTRRPMRSTAVCSRCPARKSTQPSRRSLAVLLRAGCCRTKGSSTTARC